MNLSPSLFTEMGSTRLIELGHRLAEDSTGRVWRYAKAGAANLSRGKLTVAADYDAQRVDLSFATAPAIGDKVVSVTIGTGAATANDYRDGWLVVQDGTGEGRAYPIEGHEAITASTAGNFNLKEAIDTAGAVSEANVDLLKSIYDGVVISNPDQADIPVGVPVVAITAAYYGWVQTYGPCALLADETTAIGKMMTIGSSVSGAQEMNDAAGEPCIGVMGMKTAVDTEYQLVDLQIKA